jgi:hypothetical protein
MRLSQAQFAAAVRAAGNAMGAPNQCTKRLVQKWETGEHSACRPDYLRVLQAVTGLSARELGFRVQPDTVPDTRLGLPADGAGAAAWLPSAEDASAGVRRSIPSAFPGGATGYDADAMLADSMSRLRYALEHPSMVDSRTADFVETTTSRLFDLEHHSPARLLAPTVDRHLATVTALLTAARHETVRRRLMTAAGRTAALAGWLAFDRGDTASANRFWDTAISAAESTLDGALLACSLTYLSYSAERRGDPGTAWQLAHTASWHTPEDRRATAWSTARAALYAAQVGERASASTAMELALQLGVPLPSPRPGDGSEPWTRFFDRAGVFAATAHTAALLGDRRACDFATEAVASLGPARVKSRAMVLAESALAAALAGEFELCLDYGGVAAGLARDLDMSLAADVLYAVVPIIMPHSNSRAVRELLPQLALLTRTADRERGWDREADDRDLETRDAGDRDAEDRDSEGRERGERDPEDQGSEGPERDERDPDDRQWDGGPDPDDREPAHEDGAAVREEGEEQEEDC